MQQSFRIGIYWGSRAETLSEVTTKTLNSLLLLSKLDDQFANLYETGMSRKQALTNKVPLDYLHLEKIYGKASKKDSIDSSRYSNEGFSMYLWTGHEDSESSSISFYVGDSIDTALFTHSIVITIPDEGEARNRLLNTAKAKAIVAGMAEIWNPDKALLFSHELWGKINTKEIGWITYVKKIRRTPKTSDNLTHEKQKDGHLFTVSQDGKYDVNNSLREFKSLKAIVG